MRGIWAPVTREVRAIRVWSTIRQVGLWFPWAPPPTDRRLNGYSSLPGSAERTPANPRSDIGVGERRRRRTSRTGCHGGGPGCRVVASPNKSVTTEKRIHHLADLEPGRLVLPWSGRCRKGEVHSEAGD